MGRLNLKEIEDDKFDMEVYEGMLDFLSEEKPPLLDEISKHNHGQVIFPTGTGKSVYQQMMIVDDIKECFPERRSYLIASHRLLLNKQLLVKISGALESLGVKFNVLFVGSGKESKEEFAEFHKDKDISHIVEAKFTTRTDEIEKFKEKTINGGKYLLIVSTYNSIDKLYTTPIRIGLFDEAHESTTKEFTENLKMVLPMFEKKFFFTATRKVVDIERGMNDKNIYGEVIVSMTNRDAIDKNLIVQPKLHFVDSGHDLTWPEVTLNQKIDLIISCFSNHKQQIDSESYDPKSQGAKLLFTMNNQKDIKDILTNERFLDYCGMWSINTLGVCSDHKYINGEEVNAIDIEKGIASAGNKEDMMLFHIKMLTAGIDIPSLTGVVIFNLKELSSMSQVVGRALRINPIDRKNILNKTYDKNKAVKPFAYVIIPMFIDEVEMKDMVSVIDILYKDYNMTEEFIVKNEEYMRKKIEDIAPYDVELKGCDKKDLKGLMHRFVEIETANKHILLERNIKELKNKIQEEVIELKELELEFNNL